MVKLEFVVVIPVNLSLSLVLVLSPGLYVCHNGKSLNVESSIGALGLFPGCTIRLYSWAVAVCQLWCLEVLANEESRSARSSPQNSTYLDTHSAVGCVPQGFPSSSFSGGGASHGPSSSHVLGSPPINPGMVHGPLVHLLKDPKLRLLLGVAPTCLPNPLLVLALVM